VSHSLAAYPSLSMRGYDSGTTVTWALSATCPTSSRRRVRASAALPTLGWEMRLGTISFAAPGEDMDQERAEVGEEAGEPDGTDAAEKGRRVTSFDAKSLSQAASRSWRRVSASEKPADLRSKLVASRSTKRRGSGTRPERVS